MVARREFLKIAGAATGAIILDPLYASSYPSKITADYFTVHPFIEQNPDAVFIMRTDVDVKTNSEAVKQAGLLFGQSVFRLSDDDNTGVPLSHFFPIKPNLTSWTWNTPENVDFEKVMGIITDVYFVEGVIKSMKALGISAEQFYILDANGSENYDKAGYGPMGERTGADIQLGVNNPQLQWVYVPEGVWFNQIPYLWPINTPNSWLLNIAKLKAHGMGLTLSAKNLQGSIASPYVRHCSAWGASMGIDSKHIQPDAFDVIAENYNRHKNAGIPRWDIGGSDFTSGLGMETWVTRCLDNNSVLKPGLNVIEGIYGRDGNGFYYGPHEGVAQDFMTNIIIFGKNAFYVDIIGKWLGGHEPGNFGLFHIAKERDLINTFNPGEIPLYEWNKNSEAMLSNLESFERTDLLTPYLTKSGEDQWHLCNEPYEYETSLFVDHSVSRPKSFILQQNYPNPFNPSTSIEFILPGSGKTRLEIFNSHGEIVDVIADGYYQKGTHLAVWRNYNLPPGTYFYRLRFNSFNEVKKMILIK